MKLQNILEIYPTYLSKYCFEQSQAHSFKKRAKQRACASLIGSYVNSALFFSLLLKGKTQQNSGVESAPLPKRLFKKLSETARLALLLSLNPLASLVTLRYTLFLYETLSWRLIRLEQEAPAPSTSSEQTATLKVPPSRASIVHSVQFDQKAIDQLANHLLEKKSWNILRLKKEIIASLRGEAAGKEPVTDPFLIYIAFFLHLEKSLPQDSWIALEHLIENSYEIETEERSAAIEALISMQQALKARRFPYKSLKELKAESSGGELEKYRMASKIQKSQIAFRFSLGIERAKGVSGALLIKDLKKETKLLGVFKPTVTYASPLFRFKKFAGKYLFRQAYFLKDSPLAAAQAEVASHRIDRFFGFDIVSASELVSLGGQEGSFQMAAGSFKKEAFQEAKQLLEQIDKEEFLLEEEELFQRYILHDFLIGNLDAHDENWFVSLEKGRIKEIIGIDKGNSFVKKNPWGYLVCRRQYAWRDRALSKRPFSEKMRNFMRGITSKKLEEFFSSLEKQGGLEGFFDEEMKNNLVQRARAIRKLAKREGSTPYDLSQLISDQHFLDLTSRRGVSAHPFHAEVLHLSSAL